MTENLCVALERQIYSLGDVYARKLRKWNVWDHDDYILISPSGQVLQIFTPFAGQPIDEITLEETIYFATVLMEYDDIGEIKAAYLQDERLSRLVGYVLLILERLNKLSTSLSVQVNEEKSLFPLRILGNKVRFYIRRFNFVYLAAHFAVRVFLEGKNDDSAGFESKPERSIEILVASNQELEDQPNYSVRVGDISKKLNYARFNVHIPKNHQRGKIELPTLLLKSKYFSSLINPMDYFQVSGGEVIPHSEFIRIVANSNPTKSCFLYIHGYRNSLTSSLLKAAQLKVDLSLQMPVVAFVWPSNNKVIAYAGDIEEANSAALPLAELLKNLNNQGINNIYILAHSRGAYVLSESLQFLQNESVSLTRVLLASADVSQKRFKQQHHSEILKLTSKPIIQVSTTDLALSLFSRTTTNSRRLGDASHGVFTAEGCETVDMSSCRSLFTTDILGHSYTARYNNALDELKRSLVVGVPAEERGLDRICKADSDDFHWRLPRLIKPS
ncbi:MAG: hypothetical protein CMF22_04685 [Idiomarinaceae bacterium]|nr:hypothetical protein [Idiomarinaceae bacterium]|tara:strand:+ start:5797 stop:7299 length:1503 start_codon:yes stop_codon:yes gene_type:complete